MADRMLSVGLDVGTTSTQLILSQLTVENRASAFSVPDLQISQRQVLYKSPVHFTPLLTGDLVDGAAIRRIVKAEYAQAGIAPSDVDIGAIIITGETSRKENAAAVLQNLSDFAGDFVVATAGPDLESVLAAKGAGAVAYSQDTGRTVLHMDIGGGTSNLALIENGIITATGCLNVGGRLVKLDEQGCLTYVSSVLSKIFPYSAGQIPGPDAIGNLAETLASALEMAAGLRPKTKLLEALQTKGASALPTIPEHVTLSFSGGVADCIQQTHPDLAFGDMGPALGQAIRRSRLCQGPYRLGSETIRATVIGAGSHATDLSGSTVYHQNIPFPLKNLPVVTDMAALRQLDVPGVLALAQRTAASYGQILALAEELVHSWPQQPLYLAMEADMAKALGHALALRLPKETAILCLDRVQFPAGSYLDVGAPLGSALPIVIKTLILER